MKNFSRSALCAWMVIVLYASALCQQNVSQPSLSVLDGVMNKAVADGNIPGGVLLVGHNGAVVYRKAFGHRSLEPTREAMTADTIFDIASLTKCVATTASVMKLVEQGKVRLNDPVSVYLPDFAQNGKRDITIRELLTHFSGLTEDLDLSTAWQGHETAYRMAMEQRPVNPPGARFLYSDINFEVLGFLVERVSGEPLNEFAHANIFAPLGMTHTRFLPPPEWRDKIAPTEYDERNHMLRGVVHDPTARRMGGVAGHAGVFSTADDLALFAQELLSGHTILGPLSVEKMSTPQQPANAPVLRGLGWDIDSPFSTNRGELLPIGSFGHTGYTGTSLWIDPVTNTYIILLTNAVHPHAGKSVVALRARVANAVASALNLTVTERDNLRLARITGYNETLMAARRMNSRTGEVQNGVDVLESVGVSALKAKVDHSPIRVGLVANQTSVDAHGRRTADVLAKMPGVKLAAIFSPEHGIAGMLDTEKIGDSTDEATGAPIFSVYGATDAKRRPTERQLENVDVLIYDIQDIGVRFYTYESTMGYFLEAAAKYDKPIVILDRPNPLGGAFVQGPMPDPGRESFVSYGRVPVRHGMTSAELAKMYNSERKIGARLTVVSMRGWQRGDWFDSTGQLWINPSPNMRSLTEATLYPGIGLIEGTNISVGRGTDTPFEVVGAPWMHATEISQYLNAREIAGVRFVPVEFTPTTSVYSNQRCGGVNLVITERNQVDGPELGLEIAYALLALYPAQYKVDAIDQLLVNSSALSALKSGQDPRRITQDWRNELEQFEKVRAKYLLY
ncbi:MAG TPA: exo-beta-N-acetylmuramidase NamZ domain-containing protein [Candidatus Acidoferrales bacterium]|nr:exo-beta-N-acetylmuramidase NamZ domain-containing protein [Candidatus Acidoferrales bacterium]